MLITCTKCGIEKELSNYRKDAQKKGGIRRECKECISKRNPRYWRRMEKLSQGYKRCKQCDKAKYETEYHKDSTKKDGLYSICIDCRRNRIGAKKNTGKPLTSDGYKREGETRQHRAIMERVLGRKLKSNEHVHHINGDKQDNRLENLQLMTASEHKTHHLKIEWEKRGGKQGKMLSCTKCGAEKYHCKSLLARANKTEYMCQKCYYKSKKWLKNLTKQDYVDRGKKGCLIRWGNKKRT